ncbi:hypothetical protein Aple_051050 [Acrocarpospora pleiomorpha]|uniref:Uncharacterized protein n=1 Tax=Acrocarpospora pleiomorpha TaxID=90975 RepID=A0A5M3XUW8_9ACTN|nr:hypothetical protein [Acrocarpospora pleiomorpha]GES22208.1 hypothetical protein Aple_051050 [Acrocarpospora pleiomorpha]
MTLHISDDRVTSDQVGSYAWHIRRTGASCGTWLVSYLPGATFTREQAVSAVRFAEDRAVFYRLWDTLEQQERHLGIGDDEMFLLNCEIATTSTQGAAPLPPRTVAAPCHPTTSKDNEVIPW